MATRPSERFEVGRVLSRAFETIGSNPAVFFGLSLLFSGGPNLALQLFGVSIGRNNSLFASPEMLMALVPGIFLGAIVAMVLGAILQAALTRAAVASLSGDKPGFGAVLGTGLTLALPVIGISFLEGLAMLLLLGVGGVLAFGLMFSVGVSTYSGGDPGRIAGAIFGVLFLFVLLAIPMVMLYIRWLVAIPAYVAEREGVIESLGRSAELTRGSRWNVLVTMIITGIATWILTWPAGLVTLALGQGSSAAAIIAALVAAVSSMFVVTVQASAYVELRHVRDGVLPTELEEIFA